MTYNSIGITCHVTGVGAGGNSQEQLLLTRAICRFIQLARLWLNTRIGFDDLTFPDTKPGSLNMRYTVVGNAVPPPRWLRISRVLSNNLSAKESCVGVWVSVFNSRPHALFESY